MDIQSLFCHLGRTARCLVTRSCRRVRRGAVLPHQNAALGYLRWAAGRTPRAICSRWTKWLHPS